MPSDESGQRAAARAVRLIFEYEGETVRLVSQRPVNVRAFAVEPGRTPDPGYYIDSRNAAGILLARVAAHEAFASSAEVFPERLGEPITRIDVPTPRGAFTVVVPLPEGADHVTIVRVAQPRRLGGTAPTGAAISAEEPEVTDIADFPLQTDR